MSIIIFIRCIEYLVKLICRMDFKLYMFVNVDVKCIGCIGMLKNIK